MEEHFKKVQRYIDPWLNYEALYAIDILDVEKLLGDNIDAWDSILTDIKEGRSIFDAEKTTENFGVIIIDFRLI
jgi:dynein heavy chain 1